MKKRFTIEPQVFKVPTWYIQFFIDGPDNLEKKAIQEIEKFISDNSILQMDDIVDKSSRSNDVSLRFYVKRFNYITLIHHADINKIPVKLLIELQKIKSSVDTLAGMNPFKSNGDVISLVNTKLSVLREKGVVLNDRELYSILEDGTINVYYYNDLLMSIIFPEINFKDNEQ